MREEERFAEEYALRIGFLDEVFICGLFVGYMYSGFSAVGPGK